jgi:hypothetical protein
MLGDQGSGGGLDLLAINRDADLLDLLARRAPVPAGDPVLALLAALAADVDEGLDELLVAGEDDPLVRAAAVATVVPEPPAPRRGRGLRATTVAIVVGATLSIGGVAAAVTGDPLAPVKGFATAVGVGADKHEGKLDARDAHKQARSQLRHGDLAGAQASLAAMKAVLLRDDLSKGDRRSIEARIAALQKQLDHAVAKAADRQGDAETHNGNGKANGKVDDGTGKVDDGTGKVDNGKVDDGTGPNGNATGRGAGKASGGTSTSTPHATRTTGPGAGTHGGAGDGKKAGVTTDRVRPSQEGGSGNRPREASPSSDDSEDAPATATASADPSTSSGGSGGSGSHKATGDSTAGDGDSGASSSKAATKGAATAR